MAATTSNQIAYASSTATYDNNGNLTAFGADTYAWDYRNRLTRSVVGATTTHYSYDHTGERVGMKEGSAATTTYVSDLYSLQSGTTTKHIFAGGILIATVEGNGQSTSTRSLHPDHLGGTHTVTNASGTVVQTLDYYPFGQRRISAGSDVSQREYIGEHFDESSSLSYLNARYYTGDRGQFLSQDPVVREVGSDVITMLRLLRDPQQLNSYSYARNNPISIKDPSGELSVSAILSEIKSVLGQIGSILSSLLPGAGSRGGGTQSGSGASSPNASGSSVLPNSAWKPQPRPDACLSTCEDIAGYKTSAANSIVMSKLVDGKLVTQSSAKQGVETIDRYLADGSPVIVGVNWGGEAGLGLSSGANDATQHYVTIVGSGHDTKGQYYRFFDVGTSRESAGTSQQNRLYVGNNSTLTGTSAYNSRTYTVTEVRPKP